MNSDFSSLLNFSRWFAAFLVAIGHVRHVALVDYGLIRDKSLFIKFFYFMTGLGHEAVVIFFVISGYLVGGLTFRKWSSGVQYKEYFAARVSRVYTVLFPALIVGGILDLVGSKFYDESMIYSSPDVFHTISIDGVISEKLNAIAFFGNIINLEGVYFPIFGSNGPLWSLAYEWWYYVIFAVVLAIIFERWVFRKIIAILVLGVLIYFLKIKLILWILVWLFGVGVCLYLDSNLPRPPPYIGTFILFAAIFISRLSHNTENVTNPESMLVEFFRDFGVAVAFSIFLLSFYGRKSLFSGAKFHKYLADFSYSMYLFHFPLLILIVAFSHDLFGFHFLMQPDKYGIAFVIVTTAVLYIYGLFMSVLTERNSGAVRKAILSSFL